MAEQKRLVTIVELPKALKYDPPSINLDKIGKQLGCYKIAI